MKDTTDTKDTRPLHTLMITWKLTMRTD